MAFLSGAELRASIDRVFAKVDPWLGAGLLFFEYVVFLVYVPIKQRGGFSTSEGYNYIAAHLTPRFQARGMLAYIFDQHLLDDWGFQNRNLSYLVDFYDVQFIGWSVRHGIPHLLAFTHFLGVGLLLVGAWYLFRRVLDLDRAVSFLLCTLLLLTPTFHTTASYSRSSKIATGIEVMILAILSLRWLLGRALARWEWGLLWVGAFVFSFFDFVAVAMCIYFALLVAIFLWLRHRDWRNLGKAAAFFGPILAINQCFGHFAVPLIHEHFYGDRYHFAQVPTGPVRDLLHHPLSWFFAVLGMFVDQLRFYLGSFPFAVAVLGVLCLFGATYEMLRRRFSPFEAAAALFVVVVPLLGIWTLLKIGNEPIFHEVFRRLYYPLPFQVLIAVGMGVFFAGLIRDVGPNALRVVKVFLWLAVLGAASSLDTHINVVRSSYLAPWFDISPKILSALRDYAAIHDDSQQPQEVRNNDLYRMLRLVYDQK